MRIDTEKPGVSVNPDDEYEKFYLVHHMHHLNGPNGVKHELHHCNLYAEKGMNGASYRIFHEIRGNEVVHRVIGNYSGVLYDHADHAFEILNGCLE